MYTRTLITCDSAYPLSHALQENRRPGTSFRCHPGVHLLPGAWAFEDQRCLADECEIVGVGGCEVSDVVLRLSGAAVRTWQGAAHGDRSLNPLWVGRNCRVTNVTIDGNERAFRHDDPSKAWYVPSGIRAFGGGLTVSGVHITGLRGARVAPGTNAKAVEAFGISTTDDFQGGNTVEDVAFSGIPADAYFSAVYIGSQRGPAGETPRPSQVRRVTSHVGKDNWFLLAGGIGVLADTLSSSGHQVVFYNDTNETERIELRRVDASGVRKVVSLVAKDATSKSRVKFVDSEFAFVSGNGNRYAAELWDQVEGDAPPIMGQILFERCRFLSRSKNFLAAAVVSRNAEPIEFRACVLPASPKLHEEPGGPDSDIVRFDACTTPTGASVSSAVPFAPV